MVTIFSVHIFLKRSRAHNVTFFLFFRNNYFNETLDFYSMLKLRQSPNILSELMFGICES